MKKLSLFLLLSILSHWGLCQTTNSSSKEASPFSSDPEKAQMHTEDIALFWKIFDQTYPKLKGSVWQESYINQGSIGLQGFIRNRIESGNKLAKTIKKNLAYYQAIREQSLNIAKEKEQFYKAFRNLEKLYPQAVFPDVYFVVGRKNSGGTIFSKGLIIGAERFGKASEDFQPDIDMELLDNVVAHELIHFQQRYVKDNSLLAQCIREGAADFLAEMISGSHANQKTYAFGDAHKAELWKEFFSRKDQNNWYNWLYYSRDKSRPQDLGYWMGYQICKAYYDKMEDKTQAIYDILNIKDFQSFLEKSGYQGT